MAAGGLSSREMLLEMTAIDNASAAVAQVGGAIQTLGTTSRVSGFRLFALGMILQRIGRQMYDAGRRILSLGMNAIQAAMQFDYAMRLVQTQAQLTGKNFAALERGALSVSTHVASSADEIAQGLFDIFSSIDVSYKNALTMVKLLSKGATAGGTDVRTVTRGVIQILNAFDLKATDTKDILNLLFQQLRKSTGTFEEVVAAWGNVVSAGRMANQTLQTLAGSVAFLTLRGRTQAQATISVSRALDQLTRASNAQNMKDVLGVDIFDKATGDYKQLNVIIGEMAVAMEGMSKKRMANVFYDIFGAGSIQANRFFRLAIPGIDKLNDSIDQMSKKNIAGQFQKAWSIMKGAPSVQWQILVNRMKALAITVGTLFLPVAMKVIKWGQELLQWLRKLDPALQKQIATWAAVAGVILLVGGKFAMMAGGIAQMASLLVFMTKFSAVSTAVGASAPSVTSMFAKLVAGGLVALVVIAALAAAAYLIWKNWSTIKPLLLDFWDEVKTRWADFVSTVMPIIQEVWTNIKTWAFDAWDFLTNLWQGIAEWFRPRWEEIKTDAQLIWTEIKRWLKIIWDIIVDLWQRWGDNLKAIAIAVWNAIKEYIQGAVNVVKGIIDIALGIINLNWRQVWNGIKLFFAGLWDILFGLARLGWKAIREGLKMAWEAVAITWEIIWNGIKAAFELIWHAIVQIVENSVNAILIALAPIDWLLGPNVNIPNAIDVTSWNNPIPGYSDWPGHTPGVPPGWHGPPQPAPEGRGLVPTTVRDLHVHIEPRNATVNAGEIRRELDWYLRTGKW